MYIWRLKNSNYCKDKQETQENQRYKFHSKTWCPLDRPEKNSCLRLNMKTGKDSRSTLNRQAGGIPS